MTATSSTPGDPFGIHARRQEIQELLGLVEPDQAYLAAVDAGVDELLPIVTEMAAELGAGSARMSLMRMFVKNREKTAALLAAALVRLAAVEGGDRS